MYEEVQDYLTTLFPDSGPAAEGVAYALRVGLRLAVRTDDTAYGTTFAATVQAVCGVMSPISGAPEDAVVPQSTWDPKFAELVVDLPTYDPARLLAASAPPTLPTITPFAPATKVSIREDDATAMVRLINAENHSVRRWLAYRTAVQRFPADDGPATQINLRMAAKFVFPDAGIPDNQAHFNDLLNLAKKMHTELPMIEAYAGNIPAQHAHLRELNAALSSVEQWRGSAIADSLIVEVIQRVSAAR